MPSDNFVKPMAMKTLLAIVAITGMVLAALSESMDGEILKFAIVAVCLLGGADAILDYWYARTRTAQENLK